MEGGHIKDVCAISIKFNKPNFDFFEKLEHDMLLNFRENVTYKITNAKIVVQILKLDIDISQ